MEHLHHKFPSFTFYILHTPYIYNIIYSLDCKEEIRRHSLRTAAARTFEAPTYYSYTHNQIYDEFNRTKSTVQRQAQGHCGVDPDSVIVYPGGTTD